YGPMAFSAYTPGWKQCSMLRAGQYCQHLSALHTGWQSLCGVLHGGTRMLILKASGAMTKRRKERVKKMYCKVCGNEIKENANFCPVCGTPVADGITEVKEDKEAEVKTRDMAQNGGISNTDIPNADIP